VKWAIDPTLDGDAYADRPYLYSPAVASWNQFSVGEKIRKDDEVPGLHGRVVEEGAEGSGVELREQLGVPWGVSERRRHFQTEEARNGFVFEKGRAYWVDFGNPYLGFNGILCFFPRPLSRPFCEGGSFVLDGIGTD
jgi:hypothetical protein